MLTIICGDNTVESRAKYLQIKQEYSSAGYEVVEILNSDIASLTEQFSYAATLFHDKRLYTIENVISKKAPRDFIIKLIGQYIVDLLIWEERMDDRSIKKYFPKAKILVSKLPHTLWKFIDNIYPGNLVQTLSIFAEIKSTVEPSLIHYMTIRRAKELLLVAGDSPPSKLAAWQIAKLKQQAKLWPLGRLESFFSKLIEIEMQSKNGTMVYDLDKALEITLCFYL